MLHAFHSFKEMLFLELGKDNIGTIAIIVCAVHFCVKH